MANRYISKMKICATLNISKRLKTLRADGDSRPENFGEKGGPAYVLGLFEEHYFVVDPAPVTAYALEHFDAVTALPEYIDSFKLFSLLLANRDALLKPIV